MGYQDIEKQREYDRKYRKEHLEEKKENDRKYYAIHCERYKENHKKYYEKNRKKCLKKMKKYNIIHADKIKEYHKEYHKGYYIKHGEKRRQYEIKYRALHPGRYKEWSKKNIEHVRDYSCKKKHGITLEEKNNMVKYQGDRCAICGNKFNNYRDTHVDHCHETNKLRGILCGHCNIGLGQFRDNIEIMQKAIDYIRKYS